MENRVTEYTDGFRDNFEEFCDDNDGHFTDEENIRCEFDEFIVSVSKTGEVNHGEIFSPGTGKTKMFQEMRNAMKYERDDDTFKIQKENQEIAITKDDFEVGIRR